MKYIIGLDQSTQGTKAVLFDETGKLIARADRQHKQIVNDKGWVSHNLTEIYQNVLQVVPEVIEKAGISKDTIAALGISNQRETTAMWNREGVPYEDAIVWQCNRAETIALQLVSYSEKVKEKTGLPISAYFPAAKMKWFIDHVKHDDNYCIGTIDTWLVYRLTNGNSYKTDVSNASRTQLFNIHTLTWDKELCEMFGISMEQLPEVCDSNHCFGMTDFDGYFSHEIPIHTVMGDSHAALYAQGCHQAGMVKATYGTGSSIMMNTGKQCMTGEHGLAVSIAWSIDGQTNYVLEGNVNYAGASISWLMNDIGLISSMEELMEDLKKANREDETVLVPAFTGLGAPYWNSDAKAMFYGMGRMTGKEELIKATVESIAYQVLAVVEQMQQVLGNPLQILRVDGGPTKNEYLMQFQADISALPIAVSSAEELSALGVAYMAGITMGIYHPDVFKNITYRSYQPFISSEERNHRKRLWDNAIKKCML
ncbi:MAG: glycerol kinase [Lachnospiraceae bacterium]